MSIRPKYGKRSVLQVLSDGMSQHPPTGKSCCEDAALNAAEVDRLTRERDEARALADSKLGYPPLDLRHADLTNRAEKAEDDAKWYRDLALKADATIEETEHERDELQRKLDDLTMTVKELAPAKQTTLDREAVKKVLEPVLYDVTMSAAVTNAILALAPAVPSWLGDVPDKPKVKRAHSGEWQAGSGLYQGSVTSRECRSEAWELLALADAIDTEEAQRNDDEQRIEEQAKALAEAVFRYGGPWDNVAESARERCRAAIRAGWGKEADK